MSENGKLKPSELRTTVIFGELVPAASRSADRLALAFALEFGKSLVATDTYRTRAEQDELARTKPHLAAPPGTSVHGLGEAVDFASNIPNASSKEHKWMDENAFAYGWTNPAWARATTRFEPWHWEYNELNDRKTGSIKFPSPGQVGLGDRSDYVKSVQKFYNHMFGDKPQLVIDGEYWMATYAAVYRFQRRVGITPTGVIGTSTKKHLKRHGFPL